MNQEFTVGQLKIIEDEQGFGVALQRPEGWIVIATFKYGLDAVRYFTEYIITFGNIEVGEDK